VSKFRGFGCEAFLYLNKERRELGKHIPRAVKGVNLGFASDSNTSGYVIYRPGGEVVKKRGRFPYVFPILKLLKISQLLMILTWQPMQF
jgi:hypothetical protein